MINLLAVVSKGLINQYMMSIIYALLGLLAIPILCFLVAEFVGRHVQNSFGYAFGAHTQAIFGGVGAVLHEFYELIVAFLCGHSLSMVHMHTIHNIKFGFKLDSSGHLWSNHGMWNTVTNFFLGILPYYMMVFTLIGCQFILGGQPITHSIITKSLKTYLGIATWKTMIFNSLSNDLSVSAIGFIPLIAVVIVLCLNGFYISSSENSSTFEGSIPWAIILAFVSIIFTTMSYTKSFQAICIGTMNICIWITMKLVWYLLAVWCVILCFSAINHTTDTATKAGRFISAHTKNKKGNVIQNQPQQKNSILSKLISTFHSKSQHNISQQPAQQMRIPVQHKYVQKPSHFANPNMNPNYNPMPQQPQHINLNQSKMRNTQPLNNKYQNTNMRKPVPPQNNNKIQSNKIRYQQPRQRQVSNRPINNRQHIQPQINNKRPRFTQHIPNRNNNKQPIQKQFSTQNQPKPQNKQSENKGIKGKIRGFFLNLDNKIGN